MNFHRISSIARETISTENINDKDYKPRILRGKRTCNIYSLHSYIYKHICLNIYCYVCHNFLTAPWIALMSLWLLKAGGVGNPEEGYTEKTIYEIIVKHLDVSVYMLYMYRNICATHWYIFARYGGSQTHSLSLLSHRSKLLYLKLH